MSTMDLFELAGQLQNYEKLRVDGIFLTAVEGVDGTPIVSPWSMTLDELRAIDSRLPIAVEAQIAHRQMNNNFSGIISARLLTETALYWTGTKMIPTDWGVTPYHKLCYFGEVNLEATPPKVPITILRCDIMPYTSDEGTKIEHVRMFGGMSRPVDIGWLDAKYPGWQERYRVAVGLGYEKEDLLELVLVDKPTVNPILPTADDLDFD